jgi:hypothetical protein
MADLGCQLWHGRLAAGGLGATGRRRGEHREDAATNTAGPHPRNVEMAAGPSGGEIRMVLAGQRIVMPVEHRSHAPTVSRLAIVPPVEGATAAETQGLRPPSRVRLFAAGALGLPLAVVLGAAAEAALRAAGSQGRVPSIYFAAVAALTVVLALGLLVQLLTALTGRTSNLMREMKRFDAEMDAEVPQLSEESHRDRMVAWAGARLFIHAVKPFGAGVLVQLAVCEILAVVCLAAGIHSRLLALVLGAQVVALFVYLLLFGRMLTALTSPRRAAPV